MCDEHCDPFFEYLETSLGNNSTKDTLVGDRLTIADYLVYAIYRQLCDMRYGSSFENKAIKYISAENSHTFLGRWIRRCFPKGVVKVTKKKVYSKVLEDSC